MVSLDLGELSRRYDAAGAKRMAREVLRSSPSQAHHDVMAAERLAGLPATCGALASGEVPADHARLIARASSEWPIDEAGLVEAARTQAYDELARTVKRQQHELSGDGGQSIHDRRRQRRCARLFQNSDTGMYVLNAELDPVTGSHIAGALAAKEREMWRQEDPKQRRTHPPALRRCPGRAGPAPGEGQSRGVALVLIADYDAARKALVDARLCDGTPLPAEELVKLACDADVFPAVFNARTQDLWLGRRRRCASDAQRIALMVRDKVCVGCGADANRSFAHHIDHWRNGGGTDYPILLFSQVRTICCNSCCNTSQQGNPRSGSSAVPLGLLFHQAGQPLEREITHRKAHPTRRPRCCPSRRWSGRLGSRTNASRLLRWR